MLNEQDLGKMFADLKPGDQPYSLFLGAGASISSGIPCASTMVKAWKTRAYQNLAHTAGLTKKSKLSDVYFEYWEKGELCLDEKGFNDEPHLKAGYEEWYCDVVLKKEKGKVPDDFLRHEYSNLFKHFHHTAEQRQHHIEQIVDEKMPTFGYLYLAGLIAQQKINTVFTTNFDDLVADALFGYYRIRPLVCAFDSAVSSIRLNSLRPKILKLHGDFLFDHMKNTRQELSSLDQNMEEKFQESCKNSGLVVVGYGAGDQSIRYAITGILRQPNHLAMGLHWCLRRDDNGKVITPPLVKELAESFPDKVKLYGISSFDCLMNEIFQQCATPLPLVLSSPVTNSPVIEFFNAVRESTIEELSEDMQSQLKIFLDQLMLHGEEYILKVLQADVYWQVGKNARDNAKDYDEAIHLFKKGNTLLLPLLEEMGFPFPTNNIGELPKQDERFPDQNVAEALRRIVGLKIGLAKCHHEIIDSGRNHFNLRNQLVDEAIHYSIYARDCAMRKGQVSQTIRRSILFNCTCLYGVRLKFKEPDESVEEDNEGEVERLNKNDEEIVCEMLEKIKGLDPDGLHYRKLYNDADCELLRYLFDKL